ncbi:hypothetical protein FF38_07996 [Lucilia cuprina]|uniref:Uncharacterized protein n=1 Tax=Lucilia cuprina TaxID=7375 RepID=A0A0L0CJS3_LUCCU|nr:hypothetical protein FF38_07996 [Lucilia cuprina]
MQALSEDKHSMRFILALGLRTLTLQTGDEYRDRLGIKDDNLAVLIGSKAVLALHKEGLDKQSDIEKEQPLTELGSESQESLFGEEELELNWSNASWQGSLPEDELSTVLTRPKDRALLYAPVLACTIDHIIGATETIRGGRYILPYLRLMSSDLVIDEIDDFVDKDSIAIGRRFVEYRDRRIQAYMDYILVMMWEVRREFEKNEARLPTALLKEQQIWLFPNQAREDSDVWLSEIIFSITQCFMQHYEKVMGKKAIKLGNDEFDAIKDVIATNKALLR